MFSFADLDLVRFLPRRSLADIFRCKERTYQNHLDLEAMSDHWQRDLGLLEGRQRPGQTEGNAFRAARIIFPPRNL